MADESDIELPMLVLKKNPKKPPTSPSADILSQAPKKISTKVMIHQAIVDLTTNSRKGVSLQAIKKYMVEKYNVDTEKINYYIKKSIKLGVEDGTIVQTKGIGASGSFRLAPKKPKAEKKEKVVKKKKKLVEISEKPEKEKMKMSKSSEKSKMTAEKKVMKKKDGNTKSKTTKADKIEEPTKKSEEKAVKTKSTKGAKDSKSKDSKTSKETSDPAKKKASLVKRKSIGSIIKAPKMKPKAR